MIKKSFSKTGKYCRVTFKIPAGTGAEKAVVCAEFNQWDPNARPMIKTTTGGFYFTCFLPAGQAYRFRYLVDGQRWQNDENADDYVPNAYGSHDGVVYTGDVPQ